MFRNFCCCHTELADYCSSPQINVLSQLVANETQKTELAYLIKNHHHYYYYYYY